VTLRTFIAELAVLFHGGYCSQCSGRRVTETYVDVTISERSSRVKKAGEEGETRRE
jgi:hypothetical protein